jgi:hypothetical protein
MIRKKRGDNFCPSSQFLSRQGAVLGSRKSAWEARLEQRTDHENRQDERAARGWNRQGGAHEDAPLPSVTTTYLRGVQVGARPTPLVAGMRPEGSMQTRPEWSIAKPRLPVCATTVGVAA